MDVPEALLQPDPSRCAYTMFPIRHKDVWDMYTRAKQSMWIEDEVDLKKDRESFATLTEGEKYFISNILAFFASSDGIVNENLAQNFCNEIPIPEVKAFYAFQMQIETVHSITYSQLIQEIIESEAEKQKLFTAIQSIDCVRMKTEWALRWTHRETATFAERLVAFAAVEGIFFSGSFCAIFWLKKRNLMPGLCVANEFISRDEALHRDFACLLFKKLSSPPPEERVQQIIREAVECEKTFVSTSLPVSLIGMSSESMCAYIEFVSDHLLVSMGLSPIFHTKNPFPWMDPISLQQKSNFFEKRETSYSKASAAADAPALATDVAPAHVGFDIPDVGW
jgi:ribonucleoside-diphosphate reductase beta chain